MTKPRLAYDSDLVIQDQQGQIRVLAAGAQLTFACSDFATACRLVRTTLALQPQWLSAKQGRSFLNRRGTVLELAVGDRSLAISDGRKTSFTQAGWLERLRLAFHSWRARADRRQLWR